MGPYRPRQTSFEGGRRDMGCLQPTAEGNGAVSLWKITPGLMFSLNVSLRGNPITAVV